TVVKMASNRRERTANTPTTRESQVTRTTASQMRDTPSAKVARRQCSVKAKPPAATTPTRNTAMPARCAHRGRRDGGAPRSWGLSSGLLTCEQFRPLDDVAHQEGPGQRSDAAGVRGDES